MGFIKITECLTPSQAFELRQDLSRIMDDETTNKDRQKQAQDYYKGVREGCDYDLERVRRFIRGEPEIPEVLRTER